MIFALSPSTHGAAHRIEHELEDGTRLVWELLDDEPPDALVAAEVERRARGWIARLDRVDFPPGGIAYRHVHPGPGIRRILHGELTIDRGTATRGRTARARRGSRARTIPSSRPRLATEDTAFVRVLLLPAEWAGRRTIRYLDPADEDKPRLQRATILREVPL